MGVTYLVGTDGLLPFHHCNRDILYRSILQIKKNQISDNATHFWSACAQSIQAVEKQYSGVYGTLEKRLFCRDQ